MAKHRLCKELWSIDCASTDSVVQLDEWPQQPQRPQRLAQCTLYLRRTLSLMTKEGTGSLKAAEWQPRINNQPVCFIFQA